MSLPTGIIPPLVTPLRPDFSLDLDSLCRLIDHVLARGAVGVLVLGSTGENGLLSRPERLEVVERTVAHCASRAHVMAGVPALGFKDARTDVAALAALGVGSVLVSAPYGFAHSPDELAQYFGGLREVSGTVPLVAYNVPTRVGVTLEAGLLSRLAETGVISAVKDSSGNLEGHRLVVHRTTSLPEFRRYTGSELCVDGALLGGFDGAIPGLANVFTDRHVGLFGHAAAHDWPAAARVQEQLTSLFDLYGGPLRTGSFTAVALGALKAALVQLEVIEHATLSYPFAQPDQALVDHVAHVIARSRDIA